MKYLFILCILLRAINADAQNLISNPNFSADSACPTSLNQMNYCTSWRKGTGSSTDYYNACCTASYFASIPNNMFGYQTSVSNAYAGIYAYSQLASAAPDYREYIGTTFAPLLVGKTYRVTITVSLADSSFYATDGLGAYFTTSPYSVVTVSTIPVTPQIDYSSYGIISDKDNWVTLTKTFIADSAYTNLVIGSFKTNGTASALITPYHATTTPYGDSSAYYYIDSVAVEKIIPGTSISDMTNDVAVQLFPNPLTDYATLTFDNDTHIPYTLNIYNIQGRLVRTIKNIATGNSRIERGNLDAGFYYYKLYGENDVVSYGRFVVKD